jgi:hypothetical protein
MFYCVREGKVRLRGAADLHRRERKSNKINKK